jgi:hypothetical protein
MLVPHFLRHTVPSGLSAKTSIHGLKLIKRGIHTLAQQYVTGDGSANSPPYPTVLHS